MGRLWYKKAASVWEEALPLGNGRIGGMVYGTVNAEKIQVNEESIWYGGPVDRNNPDTLKNLPKIRQLLFDGKIAAAENLMREAMSGCPAGMHPYQVLGEINLYFPSYGEVTEYERELDLNRAVSRVSFNAKGTKFIRESFISKPADCMVMKFSKEGNEKISLTAELHRPYYFDGVGKAGEREIRLWGNLGKDGYEFAMNLRANARGGNVYTLGEHLIVEDADEVILYFAADCSFHYLEELKRKEKESMYMSGTIQTEDNRSLQFHTMEVPTSGSKSSLPRLTDGQGLPRLTDAPMPAAPSLPRLTDVPKPAEPALPRLTEAQSGSEHLLAGLGNAVDRPVDGLPRITGAADQGLPRLTPVSAPQPAQPHLTDVQLFSQGLGGNESKVTEVPKPLASYQQKMWDHMDEIFRAAEEKGYEQLLREHIRDYQELFNRCQLDLHTSESLEKVPTDERLEKAQQGDCDLGLTPLFFDFGRYLMIACSRDGGLPSTLQGLWNKDLTPPWESKYTININTEMNYWPAETCNLSECHMPLFDHIERMIENGRKTARVMYGCRGFVAHHNTDIHGDTAPQDKWIPGTYWVMGAAWLCTHQWNHYLYTKDLKFLQRTYPVMAEAALFFLDFLVEYKGYLVTCPSVSPENTYILPSGEKGANGIGVTMDNQILRDLFTQCIEAYRILKRVNGFNLAVIAKCREAEIPDIDRFQMQVESACGKLIPTRISPSGRIMEWLEDYKEDEPGHRHISHLYGLHPSSQITMDGTPELAKAAAETLKARLSQGGGHTGWSRAWIINHYAKLWDGDSAYGNIEKLFANSTYPNMFDKHPPFQIDGNFGATAAIVEMIVQSNAKRIVLLPALPEKWPSGSLKGVRIVGNAYMDIVWENKRLKVVDIYSFDDFCTDVLYGDNMVKISMHRGEQLTITEECFI